MSKSFLGKTRILPNVHYFSEFARCTRYYHQRYFFSKKLVQKLGTCTFVPGNLYNKHRHRLINTTTIMAFIFNLKATTNSFNWFFCASVKYYIVPPPWKPLNEEFGTKLDTILAFYLSSCILEIEIFFESDATSYPSY